MAPVPSFSSAAELLLAAAIFCLVFWVIRTSTSRVPKGLKSPPGPWGWPLVGHALSLGRSPHLALAGLSRRYGDVMQIRLGSTPVVVLGSLDAIRQALVRQGDAFKGRPALHSFTLVTNGQSMTFHPDSGPVWAARRRLAQDALKSFSIASHPGSAASCHLEEHARREAGRLADAFRGLTARAGRFDPYEPLVLAVARVIGAMCFGGNFPQDGEMAAVVTSSQDFVEGVSAGNAADFFPLLRYLPNPVLRRFKAFNQKFVAFLEKTVREHYQDFDKDNVRDITSALFVHAEKEASAQGVPIPREKIVNIVNDIFGAGFDTITTAVSWALMYLVTRPHVQRKIHKELDAVVGRARAPRLSDRPQLPYLEAFTLELFRHSSFVPFTIPHSTTRDTVLNGFFIPKGRCVFINQWQVNHDPETWGDPSEFRPERFLTDGETALNKALSEKVLLFGLGKRRCLGETPAKWELFLFLATLLHRLEFSLAPGAEPDLTPTYGLTMKYARCPHFRAQPRPVQ
ncbi:cytochrome P450 1A2-like [Perognathus longimembris pacificus]|uniref:cytochrome P450 1A2-like n=1 Tax=Perognathus longimembris pacificus TaxID=214514 RepID=UPI0020194142|nr:cytochrome P450 1A2-like [Perognathus longimembris pacificus]